MKHWSCFDMEQEVFSVIDDSEGQSMLGVSGQRLGSKFSLQQALLQVGAVMRKSEALCSTNPRADLQGTDPLLRRPVSAPGVPYTDHFHLHLHLHLHLLLRAGRGHLFQTTSRRDRFWTLQCATRWGNRTLGLRPDTLSRAALLELILDK